MEDGKILKKTVKKGRKELLRVKLTRNDELFLYIKCDYTLEDFFKTAETKESSIWCANDKYHEFYKREYKGDVREYMNLHYDSYGNQYIRNGHLNIALLRTVGLSKGKMFKLDNNYSEETLIQSMKQIKNITKEIYQKFIKPVRVKMTLTIEEI